MERQYLRSELVEHVKQLLSIHREKEAAWRRETNASEDCGCLTLEACKLTALLPQLTLHNIRLEDYGLES